ncbi:P-loop containing nucleoside triphosphate hydrolase protein, partial [Rhexocercosporidium sp. MPI-PUGE-AT-0058]
MGENDPNDFVALSPLELIGSRPVPPPEYYLHWEQKYIGGQDELLPVVAKSDAEDNPATHEEQQYSPRRRIERGGTQLSPPQLKYIFDQAIEKFIEKFQVQNLPTLNAKAYRVWIDSRRTRTKRIQIRAAQNDIQTLEARIASHRAKFLLVPWSSSVQALKGCRNTEPTVIDIQFLKWKIDTLGQKTCPDKPDPPQSKSFLRKKARAPLAAQEAGDVANNGVPGQETEFDDDDDLEGFIVSDEESDEEDGREEEQRVDDMEDSEDDLEEIDRSAKSSSPLDKSVMDTTHTPSDASEVASTPVRKSKITKAISKVIDLTESPPSAAFSANTTAVIDLTTPEKNSTTTPKGRKLMLTNRSISPLAISSGSVGDLPPYDNPIAIAEFPYEFWEKAGDADRLLIRVLYKLQDPQSLLRFFERYSEEQLWEHLCKVMMALQTGYDNVDGMKSRTFNHLTEIVQLGNMFMSCKFHKWGEELPSLLLKILRNSKSYWYHRFYKLCSCMDGYLNASSSPEPSSPSPLAKARKSTKRQITESDEDDEGPTKRRRIRNAADTDDDDVPVILSPHSTRKRPVVEDADAREARARNKERLDEQARRRAILKAKLAESGMTLGQGKTKHIINDAAALEQGHIHVNEEIGHRIKQHQVDGVRFMWNQVVAVTNEGAMQGCLLAHTMGLGKTMQVITLLVAIAEAASSPDPTISSQIPSSLKGTSRTLVLCPPGLIDNWMDELLFWTPGNTLGDFWKLSSTLSVKDRLQTISDWHGAGGVLIVGYEMLRNLVQNKAITNRQAPLTEVEHKRVLEELLSGPDIIIADEAHKLKNAKSSLASAASQFRSKCRIALTGSPLANNVEEYHSMIEFVQPGYLGDVVEFRVKYKEPIEAGLFADSADTDRREALKKLGVLNKELALKVNRADLSVLRNDLPPKKEFVMSVPLTDIQRKVYTLYVQSLQVDDTELTKDGEVKQATLWSWLATLSLLCNHPYCFNTKIQEGKADLPKADTLDNDALDDNVTAQLLDVPLSKAGLTTAFAEEVTRLFAAEDLTQTNLSNKVVVLCQILDAAKSAGDKTLVFSSSIPTLDFLEKLFMGQGRSLARLDGKTPIAKRQRLIKTFNSGNQEVFLISTTAGGLGLNLQSANRVVIFDFKYNPIQEEQAVGRAYRIGQLKPTFVYRFVCGGTFEDNVHNKTVFKSQLASRVVDKKSPLAYAKKKFGDFLFKPKDLPQQDLSEFQGMDPAVLDKILASQAQIATIRSIVQTDTFEMDDEDRLTPEEQQEVDRMIRELDLRRNNP